MLRLTYALTVVTLLGGSVVMANGIETDKRLERGAAMRVLAGLQR